MNGKYVNEEIADSRDKNNFYYKGKKVTPYPQWKETALFPDSLYSKQYTVTFISKYQVQDVKAKPAIDFYFSPQDLERLTKSKVLRRKTALQPEEKVAIEKVKGYEIRVFQDQELVSTYYYEEDLEEFDIEGFTQVEVVGDGFHLSKKEFDLLRQEGKPINYFEEDFTDPKPASRKVHELYEDSSIIYHDTYLYCYCSKNEKFKDYKMQVYDSQIDDNMGKATRLSDFEGLFTFKIKREEALKILGYDLMNYMNEEQQLRKSKLITKLFGDGAFYAHINFDNEYIEKEQWFVFDIYCSKAFMNQVPKQ